MVGSGCSQVPGISSEDVESPLDGSSEEHSLESAPADGKGLVLENVNLVDDTLRPGQGTVVRFTLKNYHIGNTEIESIQFYNTGIINVENSSVSDSCTPGNLQQSRQGINPEMECEFDVTVPESASTGAFADKTINFRMQMTYRSQLVNNKKAYELRFRRSSEIEESGPVEETYSNGEVEMRLSADQPVPLDTGGTMLVSVEAAGNGNLVTNDGLTYTFDSRSGSGAFDWSGCSTGSGSGGVGLRVRPDFDGKAEFSCPLQSDEPLTRPVVFSVGYKYRLTTGFDAEVLTDDPR